MAHVHSMLDRFDDSRREAEAAVRINPNLSEAYMGLAVLDCTSRTKEDALLNFKRAYELDPLSPGAAGMAATAAWRTGDDALALSLFERLKEFYPKSPMVRLGLADYYMEKKEFGKAQEMINAARDLGADEPMVAHEQGLLYALMGRRAEAEEELARIRTETSESFRLTGTLWIAAALGRKDEAFETLMKMAEKHSWPFDIRFDPLYDEMRKDPRYLDFCRKVGIKP